ncbi:GTPase RsgA [Ancylomarina longa]|uniref:GTPase RsgA n=1 Tax=Ancylomarina longa TaxID=2487017 RepID=A0A434AWU9_9BACT|nr:GTPase RsgA [Ancylomarina longa]RUT78994.1 GTPase RsgA [Ancylomarina longa]
MSKEDKSIHEFDFNLICEYYSSLERQGPGSPEITIKALSFIDKLSNESRIADIGCGTGGQTMVLAQHSLGHIRGIDLFPNFINLFNSNANKLNLQDRVKGLVGSMDSLPFQNEELDLIWSEGAIYNKSGAISEKQAIATYVDKAFIVQSLDNNFNVRRIERFMLQLADENIQPVLVLTKTDLDFNKDKVENALRHISHKIPVFFTSIQSPSSIDPLRKFISTGETVVFTGSSSVGKSTLINALCRQKILQTATISDSTGKGKHTSTRREMVLMEQSGILIDTPGVKVFGVTNDDPDTLSEVLDFSSFEG